MLIGAIVVTLAMAAPTRQVPRESEPKRMGKNRVRIFLFIFVFMSVHPYQSRFGNNLSRKRRFFLKKLRQANRRQGAPLFGNSKVEAKQRGPEHTHGDSCTQARVRAHTGVNLV